MRAWIDRTSRWTILPLALALGCASAPERDGGARPQAAARPTSRPGGGEGGGDGPKKADDEADSHRYKARITDRYQKPDEKPFVLANAVVFVPEVSLFGGGGGTETKQLEVKRGSLQVEVPFARIAVIEVGKVEEDRLWVTLKLRPAADGTAQDPIEGTVKASLELRGTYAANADLKATVKLREAKHVEFEVEP